MAAIMTLAPGSRQIWVRGTPASISLVIWVPLPGASSNSLIFLSLPAWGREEGREDVLCVRVMGRVGKRGRNYGGGCGRQLAQGRPEEVATDTSPS